MNPLIRNFLPIDPGDVHQGVSYFEIECELPGNWTLWRHWTRDLNRKGLFELLETAALDAVMLEEFRLYPEMARNQGYSDFKTSQIIGAVVYICESRGIPVYLQGASLKKKARRIGEDLGFPGKERWIGTGRGRYWGWDFEAPSQHERDATAHGVYWAFNHEDSPIRGRHKKDCRLAQAGAE